MDTEVRRTTFLKNRIGLGVGALAVLLATGPLWAHHGYTVVFETSRTVTLTGTLTKVDWRNPHIEVSLDAKGNRGQTETWVIEAGPPRFFELKKVNKQQFMDAIGQTVTVEALRAKDGSLLGSLVKITFRDGKFVTSAPGA